jgi:hypothetical protein
VRFTWRVICFIRKVCTFLQTDADVDTRPGFGNHSEKTNNQPSSHHTEALRGGGYFVCAFNAQDFCLDAIACGLRLLVFHYLAIGR